MEKNGRILITGAGGYLGGAMVRHLEKSHDLFPIFGRKDLVSGLEKASGFSVSTIIHAGFEVQFRAVTQGMDISKTQNCISTERIIHFAKKKQAHLVFLSAAGICGVSTAGQTRSERDIGRETNFHGYMNSLYIQEKLYCHQMIAASEVPTTSLLLTTVYGKGMKPILPSLKSPILVCPPGGTSFLDLRDFLEALDRVLENPKVGDFIVSSGNVTYKTLYQEYARSHERRRFVAKLPEVFRSLVDKVDSPILQSTFGFKYYSAEKFIRAYRWRPVFTLAKALSLSAETLEVASSEKAA